MVFGLRLTFINLLQGLGLISGQEADVRRASLAREMGSGEAASVMDLDVVDFTDELIARAKDETKDRIWPVHPANIGDLANGNNLVSGPLTRD